MKKILFLLVFIVSASSLEAQYFVLKSSEMVEFKQYKYSFDLREVVGCREPYAAYDYNISEEGKWPEFELSDADGDGFQELSVVMFNDTLKVFWSDRNKRRANNPLMKKDVLYDPESGCISIICVDGKIYKKGEVQLSPPPSKFGDNVIGWDRTKEDMILRCNYSVLRKTIANPFTQTNADDGQKWQEQSTKIINSSGWSETKISLYDILVGSSDDETAFCLRFGFGAYSKETGKRIYPDSKISKEYVNEKGDGLRVPLDDY